jgi:hypothetical protein
MMNCLLVHSQYDRVVINDVECSGWIVVAVAAVVIAVGQRDDESQLLESFVMTGSLCKNYFRKYLSRKMEKILRRMDTNHMGHLIMSVWLGKYLVVSLYLLDTY